MLFENCKKVQLENIAMQDSVLDTGSVVIKIKNAELVTIKGDLTMSNVKILGNSKFISIENSSVEITTN